MLNSSMRQECIHQGSSSWMPLRSSRCSGAMPPSLTRNRPRRDSAIWPLTVRGCAKASTISATARLARPYVKKRFQEAAAAGAPLIAGQRQPAHVAPTRRTGVPNHSRRRPKRHLGHHRRSRDKTRMVEVFDPYAALADTEWAAAPSSACPAPPQARDGHRPLEGIQGSRIFRP
jgi:hypothetical protein